MEKRLFAPVTRERAKSNSHARVVEGLGSSIVGGVFPVGSVLPGDAELAQRFHVSRTVLREAMKTLAAKGLLVARARVGTKVTDRKSWNLFDGDVLTWHFDNGVDRGFLLHLYDVRLAFEPLSAGLAAERATPDDIALLTDLAQAMARPTHTSESLAIADLKFHLAVAEMSKNPFMQTVGHLIEAALMGILRMSSPSAGQSRFPPVYESHRRIVDAIAAGDKMAASEAMRAVILIGRAEVVAALSSVAV